MTTRELPEGTNPLLEVDNAPSRESHVKRRVKRRWTRLTIRRITDEILVERRCLGQTELKVKPGQVGTSNATKPDNLGTLDYAHLRVPLPKDLNTSGIFLKQSNRKWPESYFLMVRGGSCALAQTED